MTVDLAATTVLPHICPLCEAGCGLDIHVVDGDVTLIRGQRDDVHSRGFLCPKGTALKALQHDPDRLRRPLVKRNGTFVEVDFDEAFAEVERRLLPVIEAHGASSSGIVIGNPTVHHTGLLLYAADLAGALGSLNVFTAATLDQMPKHVSVGEMFGDHYSIPVPDIERTDLLVVIGANPIVSNGSLWSVPDFKGKAEALRARGGRLVAIDPRRTETAEVADDHIPIRPGADVFLLAAVVQVLFDEGLVSPGRIESKVNGLAAVAAAVAPFTPERVAHRTAIAADTIRALARDLAAAPRAVVYGRLGTCLQEHATPTNWLVDVINVLTGNLDEPGGAMFAKAAAFAANTAGEPGSGFGVSSGMYHSRVSGAPEVMNQFPLACLAEEIETSGDGQLRGLITMAANPALSSPDGPRVGRALASLDAMISLDVYLNETTCHADVIIPGPSPLEEAHFDGFFAQIAHRNTARYSSPALVKPTEIPDDWETMVRLVGILSGDGVDADADVIDDRLMRDLLSRDTPGLVDEMMDALAGRRGVDRRVDLGLRRGPYGDQFGSKPGGLTLQSVIDAPGGIDLGPLESRIPELLRTPSGMIELAPEPIIAALAEAASDIDAAIPECVIIGRRHLRSNNSWMHNLPVLTKGKFRCTLMVHPDDAERWQLVDGASARVTATQSGRSIEVPVEIDDSVLVGVVSLPHGWGHDVDGTRLTRAAERPGANVNVLADPDRRDRLSGNAVLNAIPVRVRPAVRAE